MVHCTKGALRFLDLEIIGPVELMPGVTWQFLPTCLASKAIPTSSLVTFAGLGDLEKPWRAVRKAAGLPSRDANCDVDGVTCSAEAWSRIPLGRNPKN
jgi:hypothetical protein